MEGEFAARYGELENWHWWFRGRRRILEAVLARELASPVRRLLSVGSGPPSGLVWLLPFAGGRVVGLDADPSRTLLAAVAPRAARPEGIAFLFGDLAAPPVRAGSIDVLLALDVLEHLEDDARALRSAVRLVRPGGLVVVTVPAFPSLWGLQDEVSHHRRRYTRRTLRGALRRAGLERGRLHFFNTLLFPMVAAVRWGRRLRGRTPAAGSDFDRSSPGRLNDLLAALFAAERRLVGRVPLPFGVSLLATARVPAPRPRG